MAPAAEDVEAKLAVAVAREAGPRLREDRVDLVGSGAHRFERHGRDGYDGDDEAGVERTGVGEDAERGDGVGRHAKLLVELAQRGLDGAGVAWLHAPAGEADLTAMRAELGAATREHDARG